MQVSTREQAPMRRALAVVVLATATACSPSSAQGVRRDSPPPPPIAAPRAVPPDPTAVRPNASNVGIHFPVRVQDLIRSTEGRARREWRRDAVATAVSYKWFPADATPKYYWTTVILSSASDGARRQYSIGAPYDGQIADMPASERDRTDIQKQATQGGVAAVVVDLPHALATLWNVGLHGSLTSMDLEVVGSANHPRVIAWRAMGLETAGLFPVTINAQVGGVMDWRVAYNAPQWTDAQMKDAWDRLLNRNQPPVNLGVMRNRCELVGGNWMPWDVCDR